MTRQTTGYKKLNMTTKEKYDLLEDKKEKLVSETKALYAKIDLLRVKAGVLEQEIKDAYRKYIQEVKTKNYELRSTTITGGKM